MRQRPNEAPSRSGRRERVYGCWRRPDDPRRARCGRRRDLPGELRPPGMHAHRSEGGCRSRRRQAGRGGRRAQPRHGAAARLSGSRPRGGGSVPAAAGSPRRESGCPMRSGSLPSGRRPTAGPRLPTPGSRATCRRESTTPAWAEARSSRRGCARPTPLPATKPAGARGGGATSNRVPTGIGNVATIAARAICPFADTSCQATGFRKRPRRE